MPKKLKVHPNQRVDIPDFNRAANEYTDERTAFEIERALLDRRARVFEGFRVRIEDQSTTPGSITVLNGTALNRDGQSLHDEDQADSSQTITLSGASTTFYVEIELASTESDTDARAFWDDTFDNGGPPTPDGAEFTRSVTTRVTPTWKIVSPVSTTGFDSTTNPNSLRIPLVALTTDGTNEITPAVNPGLSTVNFASIIEEPVAKLATSLRVFNSRLLGNVGDTIVVGSGEVTQETVTILSNDKDNGVVGITATANAHSVGEIVRTTVTARLLKEQQDPNSPDAHPDVAKRIWQGDEVRGGALAQSKSLISGRDDLNVRALKDKLDLLDALVREMKFGTFDPADTSITAPVTSYATRPRYFDKATSLEGGAGQHTVSIGNGTTSFGDFNGTDEDVFIDAIDSLQGASGTIYIKPGTYTLEGSIDLNTALQEVTFVAQYGTVTLDQAGASTSWVITADGGVKFRFEGLIFDVSGTEHVVISSNEGILEIVNCRIDGHIELDNHVALYWENSRFVATDPSIPVVNCIDNASSGTSSTISNCYFETSNDVSVNNTCISGSFYDTLFTACSFNASGASQYLLNLSNSDHVNFVGCDIYGGIRGLQLVTSDDVNFTNCLFEKPATPAATVDAFVVITDTSNAVFTGCVFNLSNTGESSDSTPFEMISLTNVIEHVSFSSCKFIASSTAGVYTQAFDSASATLLQGVTISDCQFENTHRGPFFDIATSTSSVISISDSSVNLADRVYTSARPFYVSQGAGLSAQVDISGCSVDGGSFVQSGSAIYVDNANTDGQFTISNCSVQYFGHLGVATSLKGIGIEGQDVSSSDTRGLIDNCVVTHIQTGVGPAYGIYVGGLERAQVKGCSVTHVEGTDAVGIGSGTSTGKHLIISNCSIDEITGTTTCRGIQAVSCNQAVIANNTLYDFTLSAGSLCRPIDVSAIQENASIQGNNIYLTATDDVTSCVYANYGNLSTVTVAGNVIRMDSSPTVGIEVVPNSSSSFTYGIVVEGNSVLEMKKAALATGIQITGNTTGLAGAGPIVVSNNAISEITYDDEHSGIRVEGTTGLELRCVAISGNAVYGANTSSIRNNSYPAIFTDYTEYTAVTGNTVMWNRGASAEGRDIRCQNANQGTISGNVVSAHDDTEGDLNVTGTGNFAIVGNSIGQTGGLPGNIVATNSTSTVDATGGATEPLNHLGS